MKKTFILLSIVLTAINFTYASNDTDTSLEARFKQILTQNNTSLPDSVDENSFKFGFNMQSPMIENSGLMGTHDVGIISWLMGCGQTLIGPKGSGFYCSGQVKNDESQDVRDEGGIRFAGALGILAAKVIWIEAEVSREQIGGLIFADLLIIGDKVVEPDQKFDFINSNGAEQYYNERTRAFLNCAAKKYLQSFVKN